MNGTKLCPYCAEEVRAQAIKCRYCGSRLDDRRSTAEWYRSASDRMIAGVCGGIAEWLGWSATLVRLLYVLVSVLSAAFPGILAYIVLWVLMPERED